MIKKYTVKKRLDETAEIELVSVIYDLLSVDLQKVLSYNKITTRMMIRMSHGFINI
jgi:hypothetical protein